MAEAAGSGQQTYAALSEGGKVNLYGTRDGTWFSLKARVYVQLPQFKDLAKMIARNQFTASGPAIANAIPPKIEIQIGNLINVEGNITRDVVPKSRTNYRTRND